MRSHPDAPADTAMMRIVHSALRRDLARALRVLDPAGAPSRSQQAAVEEHLLWMLGFLDRHHRSEDDGLYPLVRERDAGAATLLEDMARDHEAVAGAASRLEAAVRASAGQGGVAPLRSAIDELASVLLPHLQREEDEVMPVVSAAVTSAEWIDIEHEHNLSGKSRRELAREGHWLIDGASTEDRAIVLGLVPPVPRLVLRYGYGPSYRRRSRRCWGPGRHVQRLGSVVVDVASPIAAVWEVVRDPTRVGDWSHECVDGAWIGTATEPIPGARFRGRNRQGLLRWGRICEVVRAAPHELVWRTVPTRLYPDSTEWALRLVEVPSGTRIEQTFQVIKGSWLEPIYATILPAHRDRTEALRRDLHRIGALASRVEVPAPS